jgi:hypothetical protein
VVREQLGGGVYYVTMPKDCSCPARHLNPAMPCGHITRSFLTEEVEAEEKVVA